MREVRRCLASRGSRGIPKWEIEREQPCLLTRQTYYLSTSGLILPHGESTKLGPENASNRKLDALQNDKNPVTGQIGNSMNLKNGSNRKFDGL